MHMWVLSCINRVCVGRSWRQTRYQGLRTFLGKQGQPSHITTDLDQTPTPQVCYTYSYDHARRLRLEKL